MAHGITVRLPRQDGDDPCIVENGAYILPNQPGYSAEMFEESVEKFTFPNGSYWSGALVASGSSSA